MKFKNLTLQFASIAVATLIFTGCEPEEPPTKETMEGTWELVNGMDASGNDITSKLEFPIAAYHLSSDNGIISTGGPMIMYVVYGDNKYTNIASKIDQVFNYASLDFNGGEYFVAGGVVDRFTLEMKLEGLPGQKALTDLLDLIGIGQSYLDVVVYHKFQDVMIYFEDEAEKGDHDRMVWQFDGTTTAIYNTKDNYGNYVLWHGWPVENFSHCTFTFSRKVESLTDLVIANS